MDEATTALFDGADGAFDLTLVCILGMRDGCHGWADVVFEADKLVVAV